MITVITEPKVHVISAPTFNEHPNYPIPPEDNDPVRIGAFAAKGCYDSFGEDGRDCVSNQMALLEHRHGSVLEHIHISLWIEGITRGLSLELNRHRTFNISQRSTRYVEEENAGIVLDPYFTGLFRQYKPGLNGSFFIPGSYRNSVDDGEANERLLLLEHLNSQLDAIQSYKIQVKRLMELNPFDLEGFDLRKWARGKARNSLPHGIETRGTWTNNVRGWRWFIEARSNRHAEPEIRRLANVVLSKLTEVSPIYFEDFYQNSTVIDGIPEYVPVYSKV